MKNYTGTDVTPWEAIDHNGNVVTFPEPKDGKMVTEHNNFRVVNRVAKMHQGKARRKRR